ATVWIEGLDRIQRARGINLCVDLSATPFYLHRTGNDPGRPFPWIVSDFGLIDAIESGLVKIPQLPVQDVTGSEIPAYFNVWKWIVDEKLTAGERGGRRGQVKPEAVLRWAQQPIAQLSGLWRDDFDRWSRDAAEGKRPPVPPVFIVVCRDTRLAKVVYEWITGEGETPPPVDEFKNPDGREYTVRVDSRVVEDLATGVAKSDESRRLRFVLATIGKTAWPGGSPSAEYLDLVEDLNRKAVKHGRPRIDPTIPPGRDVRCIVSVAMLTEGWDATTVTHIVGLRPFESQLLCEQVIGRGLRRSQYHDLTVEEVAKVYGVPFELIPLKATPGTPTPPPRVHHVHALSPERDHQEITFPRVDGYTYRITAQVLVAWDRVPELRLDPSEIPDETLVKALTTDRGQSISLLGPGAPEHITLDASQPGRETMRSHLNYVIAATEKGEQSAAFYLETDPHVVAYVKNVNLGFAIPYSRDSDTREYLPDFLVRIQDGGRQVGTLILETKGYDPAARAKVAGTHRWVAAVNAEGSYGRWAYRLTSDPANVPAAVRSAAAELARSTKRSWRDAVDLFAAEVRKAYGAHLVSVVLYGSHARGDATVESDVDVLVVLDDYEDVWKEQDRILELAGRALTEHGVLISARPARRAEFEQGRDPFFMNVRREGTPVA